MDIYGTQFFAFLLEQVLAMWGVLRFYNLVRSGITWRGPVNVELLCRLTDKIR